MIVDAYESGVGHGLQNDGLNGDYYADPELNEAYHLGYDKGQQMRGVSAATENDAFALVAAVEAFVETEQTPEKDRAMNLLKQIFAKQKGNGNATS
jgi:hypothetical protein